MKTLFCIFFLIAQISFAKSCHVVTQMNFEGSNSSGLFCNDNFPADDRAVCCNEMMPATDEENCKSIGEKILQEWGGDTVKTTFDAHSTPDMTSNRCVDPGEYYHEYWETSS
ncbi:MAG: hypothetical protein AAF203_01720 [Pseudomonadota bacterium]